MDSPSLRNQGVVMTDWVMVVIGVVVVVTLNLFVTLQKEKDIGPVIIQLFVNKIADASICHLYIIMNTFNPKFMNLSFTCHVLWGFPSLDWFLATIRPQKCLDLCQEESQRERQRSLISCHKYVLCISVIIKQIRHKTKTNSEIYCRHWHPVLV